MNYCHSIIAFWARCIGEIFDSIFFHILLLSYLSYVSCIELSVQLRLFKNFAKIYLSLVVIKLIVQSPRPYMRQTQYLTCTGRCIDTKYMIKNHGNSPSLHSFVASTLCVYLKSSCVQVEAKQTYVYKCLLYFIMLQPIGRYIGLQHTFLTGVLPGTVCGLALGTYNLYSI